MGISKTHLNILLRRQRHQCHYCKTLLTRKRKTNKEPVDPRSMTIDHRVPTSRGGSHALSNKVASCTACNSLKGPLTDEEFIAVRHDEELLRKEVNRVSRWLEEQWNTTKFEELQSGVKVDWAKRFLADLED